MSSNTLGGASLDAPARLKLVLRNLQQNTEDGKADDEQLNIGLLQQLRLLGQNANAAAPLFTSSGLLVLSRYAFPPRTTKSSRLALRCIANALFLHEPARQTFVNLKLAAKAAEKLKDEDDHEQEFIIARILFLLTYKTTLDFDTLDQEHNVYDTLVRKLKSHSNHFYESGRRELTVDAPTSDMALAETTKLMFNLTVHYPNSVARFDPAIEPIVYIFLHYPLSSPPLQAPITYVMNALMNLDLGWAEPKHNENNYHYLFPAMNLTAIPARLVNILDISMKVTKEDELEYAAATLVTLLRRFYHIGPDRVKWWMRKALLPSDKDRDKPLGHGDSLTAKLLRLTGSPKMPTLRDNIAGLLWELNDKDSGKLIQTIGFGYASGFLTRAGLDPQSALESSSTGAVTEVDEMVNPVTGQRLSAEVNAARNDDSEWTEEEKEREAERLYVLFERLKATGVVEVNNPVTRRVEEVQD